ncbi:uncharacterized protein LOC142170438 [Nicotiana tabacum]|uniref:Uncharacterized protein LOC142170438 n=1 Tax=Nicotiana tabacum TaxID=4097 RepID=A0AC58SU02_TOBAC
MKEIIWNVRYSRTNATVKKNGRLQKEDRLSYSSGELVYAKCDAVERIELWDSLYAMASDMTIPWAEEDCIFKRLDRCLANLEFQQRFPGVEITHLSKIGSDHCPMLIKCDIETPPIKKPFRFLNFWVKHETFKSVVKANWQADFSADPFILFNHKLKKLKKALSSWSKSTYGDTFQRIAILEEVFLVHERQFEARPTQQNRERLHLVQAQLIRYLAIEEAFWKQKSGMLWFKHGDRNTKFFHAQVNGRRKRLKISRIQNSMGNSLEEEDQIAEEAINFYKDQFTETVVPNAFGIIDQVPCLEQAGFVKGRSNVENVLLTQEIITDIRIRTKVGPNVVIKLDMMKAYDRLSWLFLTKMFRKLGFSERFIVLVFDIVGNNWYYVLVNRQSHGLFKSSRGVKQGDPLSPTLFILAAEALSRGLNALHLNLYFCGFGMPKWSPKINHLAYADDTIMFSSSDATSLQLVMEILNSYEVASG